jgi:hypothetical protein
MKTVSSKKNDFNNFRFEGLNWYQYSNKYYSMDRVSADESKIVVRVGESHILKTKFGYALILDYNHVVFLKDWQVSDNYFGVEVLLQKEYFIVKEWGTFDDFGYEPDNLDFNTWLEAAKAQDNYKDDDGEPLNKVRWEI